MLDMLSRSKLPQACIDEFRAVIGRTACSESNSSSVTRLRTRLLLQRLPADASSLRRRARVSVRQARRSSPHSCPDLSPRKILCRKRARLRTRISHFCQALWQSQNLFLGASTRIRAQQKIVLSKHLRPVKRARLQIVCVRHHCSPRAHDQCTWSLDMPTRARLRRSIAQSVRALLTRCP